MRRCLPGRPYLPASCISYASWLEQARYRTCWEALSMGVFYKGWTVCSMSAAWQEC